MITQTMTVLGQIPAKSNNYKIAGRQLLKSQDVKSYEEAAVLQLRAQYHGGQISTRFVLIIDVYHGREAFDLDNSLKTFLDCLQYAHIISNDNMCYEIRATKHIDRRNPRAVFRIETIEEVLF